MHRRLTWGLAAALAGAWAGVSIVAGGGVALAGSPSCSLDSTSHVLTVSTTQSIVLMKDYPALEVNGQGCGSVLTVDSVTIDLHNTSNLSVTFDLIGGAFVPGATAEADGSSEIEFSIENADPSTRIGVIGSKGDDSVSFGDVVTHQGTLTVINLDAAADRTTPDDDVFIGSPVAQLAFKSSLGADVVTAAGTGVAGAMPTAVGLTLFDGSADGTYVGGSGNDTFQAWSTADGGDRFVGGAGFDRVSYATRDNAGVRVSLDGVANDGAYCPGAGCEGDNVAPDIEAVDGTGLGDVLIGTTGRQVFAGRAGPDVMIGGPGPDTFNGGPGHDTFTGGGGHDTVTYRSYVAPVHVTLDGRPNDGKRAELDNVAGDVETIIGRTANDTLTGNGGPNWLYGEGGDDHLNGGAGNDHLDGGPGHDSLDGGPGVDTCIQAPDPGSRVHCENWPRPRGGGRWSGDAGCAVLGGSIPLAQSFNNPRVDVQRRIADRRQAATGRLPGEVRRD